MTATAIGTVAVFALYEELPQLILQTQYGIFPGYKTVLVEFGLMTQAKSNALDRMLPLSPGFLNRPSKTYEAPAAVEED